MSGIDQGRRRALAGLAAAAAVGSAAPTLAGANAGGNSRRNGRVGIAVVGLGSYARYALEQLAQARVAYPVALVSGSPDKAREWAARYGIADDAIYGYDDYSRLASDERVDALHLCLPVGLHAAHALRGFAAGKHVLSEKPLAGSVGDAERMLAAASAAGRLLMPAYRAWFSDPVQDLCRRARDAKHGRLVSIDAHKGFAISQPEDNWRFDPALSGGGCLPDIGIYSVQLQRWIGGGLPRRVSAIAHHADDPRFARVESDLSWTAEFDGGVLATGSASWRYRLQNRVRAGFATAWVELDPATPGIGERMRIGADAPNRIEEPLFAPVNQLPRMYDAFAEACLGRAELPVPPQQGIDDLRMMEAIMQASRERRTIDLSG